MAAAACTKRSTPADGGADAGAGAGDAAAVAADGAQPEAAAPDAGPTADSLPPQSMDELTTRVRHLLEAISRDDPSLASDIVFPRDAYIAARDSPEAGKLWDDKVMGAFQRHVHALHKRTPGVERAQFTSFELGKPITQVVPKRRDMSMPLWRVRHSRLLFTVDGKPHHIDLTELMSWKGAWYLLSLS